MKTIKVNNVIKKLKIKADRWRGTSAGDAFSAAYRMIEKEPAIEIVNCGECAHREKSADLTYTVYCNWYGTQMPKKAYCYYGEKEKDDGT